MKSKRVWTTTNHLWANEKRLPGWGRLLHAWALAHANYCSAVPEDCAWYFREHPSRGFLGAAAFLAGGVSLQEWPTEKATKTEEGRNDLWVRLNPQNCDQDYYVEVKHTWLELTEANAIDNSGNAGSIREALDCACADVGKMVDLDSYGVGVTFCSLTSTPEIDHKQLQKRIKELYDFAVPENEDQCGLPCDAFGSLLLDEVAFGHFWTKNRMASKRPETIGTVLLAKQCGSGLAQ